MYMKTTKVSCKMTLKLIHWRELIFAFGKTLNPKPILEWLWITDKRKWQCHRISSPCWKSVFLHIYIYISNEFCDIQMMSTQQTSGTFHVISIINPCWVESLPSFRTWVLGQDDQLLGAPSGVVGAEAHPTGLPNRRCSGASSASGGSFGPFGIHGTPQKKQLSWCECGNSMKFIMCFSVFFPHFNRIFFCCDWRFEGESSHGLFCCVWLPVFTVMIYCDILHVLIVLAHIRSICQILRGSSQLAQLDDANQVEMARAAMPEFFLRKLYEFLTRLAPSYCRWRQPFAVNKWVILFLSASFPALSLGCWEPDHGLFGFAQRTDTLQ